MDVINQSTTTDMSRVLNTTRDISPPFSQIDINLAATFLVTFMVFGIIGNSLTISVIISSSKLKNIFNYFILSLCISDLTSALISWINLYRRTWGFNHFAIPNFFCWFYWGADLWTSYVTAYHIASFALLRLLSIWKPIFFGKIKLLHGKIWIGIIWVVCFAGGFIPFSIWSGARYRDRNGPPPTSRWPSCTQNQEWVRHFSAYTKYGFALFYFLPCIAVLITTIAIVVVMKRRSRDRKKTKITPSKQDEKRLKKEKQAILQVLLIVGSFVIGYLPFTVFEFYTINSTDLSRTGWRTDWLLGTLQYVSMRFSECLNPLFYNLASTQMRRETRTFLKKCFGCCLVTTSDDVRERSQTTQSAEEGLYL